MKKYLIIAVLGIIVFTACSKGKIFEKHHEFENYTWNRFKPVFFEVPVKNTEKEYNVYLTLRHITQYPYDDLRVNLTIYSPSGDERTTMHTFLIKDKEGKFLGEGAGDLWDIKLLAKGKLMFNKEGTYKFQIDNLMDYYDIAGLMDIGLIVEKAGK
ncbi:MAG: gliding motility lipoprotein GldH [Bacteroidales bacterium]